MEKDTVLVLNSPKEVKKLSFIFLSYKKKTSTVPDAFKSKKKKTRWWVASSICQICVFLYFINRFKFYLMYSLMPVNNHLINHLDSNFQLWMENMLRLFTETVVDWLCAQVRSTKVAAFHRSHRPWGDDVIALRFMSCHQVHYAHTTYGHLQRANANAFKQHFESYPNLNMYHHIPQYLHNHFDYHLAF